MVAGGNGFWNLEGLKAFMVSFSFMKGDILIKGMSIAKINCEFAFSLFKQLYRAG